MGKRTQNQRIMDRLNQGGLCAMEPLSWTPMIYRVGARIHNLREAGWPIATLGKCPEHDGAHHAYYMLQTFGQMPMFHHGPDVEVDAREVTR